MGVLQDLVLTIAGATGAVVAILGLKTWKSQLTGNAEYDLARRLLRAAYHVRDELAYSRGRFMSAGEIAASAEEANLDLNDKEAHQQAVRAARSRRYKSLEEALSALRLEELEAEVLWGDDSKSALAPLGDCISRFKNSVMQLMSYPETKIPPEERETVVRLRRIVYGSGDNDDELGQQIQTAIEGAEKFLRPRLKL